MNRFVFIALKKKSYVADPVLLFKINAQTISIFA